MSKSAGLYLNAFVGFMVPKYYNEQQRQQREADAKVRKFMRLFLGVAIAIVYEITFFVAILLSMRDPTSSGSWASANIAWSLIATAFAYSIYAYIDRFIDAMYEA